MATDRNTTTALQIFHAQFVLMSRYSVDTDRVRQWAYYRKRLNTRYVTPADTTDLRVLWEHAYQQYNLPQAPQLAPSDQAATAASCDDGMGTLVDRWVNDTVRRLKARDRWAPPEPTGRLAAGEAMAMAGFLLANDGVVRRGRPSS
ncbi:MAG TPA: hypothetical protein VHZ97_23165 [Pseudonocardiaceae bacterium]|jgi:hypothetical protein|nr:hypothetical protein [Pseudonocardiaceae bacterium]